MEEIIEWSKPMEKVQCEGFHGIPIIEKASFPDHSKWQGNPSLQAVRLQNRSHARYNIESNIGL